MKRFNLAFKAHDVHELACHFVARHAGIYQRRGLEPVVRDATAIPTDELPASTFSAACGAALADWLQHRDWRVIFVAAYRPMFWLYAAPAIESLQQLEGQVIAGYPSLAPPAVFLRQLWLDKGLVADEFYAVAAPDDMARLDLLEAGSAAAALISSAVPATLLADRGLQPLLFIGNELRLASTGLAVSGDLFQRQPELAAEVCACYQEAISLIHAEPAVLAAALEETSIADKPGADELGAPVRNCYTQDGRRPLGELAEGIEFMARALGVEPRPAAELYDFSLLR